MEVTLYLIPVPLGDSVFSRALPDYNREVILSLKHFIVENVRSARRFLKRMNPAILIDELIFTELNEHTSAETIAGMLTPMAEGRSIGVMSEAGCPAVADPGAALVAIAQKKGYKVMPLVGPSSLLLALMASGFNGQRFTFHGYLPAEAFKRSLHIKALEARMIADDETQIFIETPYRNNRLMEDLIRICRPATLLCVAANLMNEGERIQTRSMKEWKRNKPDLHKIPAIFLIGL